MSQSLLGSDQQAVMDCLGRMRGIIKRLTDAAPGLLGLTGELRLEMMDLTSRVKAVQCGQAAQRMIGEAPPMATQAPVAEMPLFAHKHVLTVAEIEAMQAFRHRENDHTIDPDEEDKR